MHEDLGLLVLDHARPARERGQLAGEEPIVLQLIRGREVRHHARQAHARGLLCRTGHARGLDRVTCAEPSHARVELDVHTTAPGRCDSLQITLVPDDHVGVGRKRLAKLQRAERAHHEHAHIAQASLA